MRLKIDRKYPKSSYIIGNLYIDNVFYCNTLELPWKDNKYRESCIPKGIYEIKVTYSASFKRQLPMVMNVPGRSGIRIHRGNWASDSTGCILPGENKIKGAVINSKKYELDLVAKLREAERRGEINTLQII